VAPLTKVVILTAIDTAVLESEQFQGATAAFDKGIGPSRLVQQLQELFSASTVHS
jgi:hypothetical protein